MGSLTQSTRVFIRRSILVLLNFVLPLFCISFVSGPTEEEEGLAKPNQETASGPQPRPQSAGHQRGRETQAGWAGGLCRGCRVFTSLMVPALSASSHASEGGRRNQPSLLPLSPRGLTCEDDQPEAPLGVPQHTAPQQHVLVAQGELVLFPVERSTEFVQLVVGRFADHLT